MVISVTRRIASRGAYALVALAVLTACASSPQPAPTSPSPEPDASQSPATPTPTDPQPSSSESTEPSEPTVTGPSDEPTETEPSASPTATQQVDVFITYADWIPETAAVEVGAVVSSFSETGTCELVLTQATRTASATADALPSASTMSCGVVIPGVELASGAWTAEVRYTSGATSGTSSSVVVTVP